MKHKHLPPWIIPDKIVMRDDGVREYWILFGFEGPGGLHSVGLQPVETRQQVIARRLALAQGRGIQ